jgi:capsule polysaccharide export protein KpsE/RkpR
LDVVYKLLTIAGITFGAWAYFHTVHPVFTKERELLDAKAELGSVRAQISALRDELRARQEVLAALKAETSAKEQQVKALTSAAETLRAELGALQAKAGALEGAVSRERIEAARAHVMRLVDRIASEAISAKVGSSFGRRSTFDLRARCLEVSKEGLARSGADEAERRAFQVLDVFAREHLKPGIDDYAGLFEIITYMVTEQSALALLRGSGGAGSR